MALDALAQNENAVPQSIVTTDDIQVRPDSRTTVQVSFDGIGTADVDDVVRWELLVIPSFVAYQGARVAVNGYIEADVLNNDVHVHFDPYVVAGGISGLDVADANDEVSLTFTVNGYLAQGTPTVVSEIAVLPSAVADPKPLDIFPHFPDAQETAVRILPYRYIAQSAVPDPWIYRLER